MRELDGAIVLNELGIELLRGASTLGALSDEAIEWLMKKGRALILNEGDTLFETGSQGDSFFIILQGTVAYYQPLNDHSEHIRDFHFGEELGFVSMVALIQRPGQAIAVNDACVLEVSNDLYYALQCDRPQDFGLLAMNLAREMARRIVTLSEMLAQEKRQVR